MNIKKIEKKVNAELRQINHRYHITNLILSPRGDYWFDFSVKFAASDMPAVNQILKKYLIKQHKPQHEEIVQAKFYLPARICQRLRELSAKLRKPQSKIVEERLRTV